MSTPAAILADLVRLQRETKALRDRLTRDREERRRLAVARIVDRAYLDALALCTLAIGGGAVGREYSPLPARRWRYAVALLELGGLTSGGRDLRLDLVDPEEAMRRLTTAAAEAKAQPHRYGAHLPDFARPSLLQNSRAV
jgi:hypothetical protein